MKEVLHSITTGHEATTNKRVGQQTINLDLDALLSPASSAEEGEYAHIEGIVRKVFSEITTNPKERINTGISSKQLSSWTSFGVLRDFPILRTDSVLLY